MKKDVVKLNSQKRLRNGSFKIVVSLLYAHCPIFFFLSYNTFAMLYLVHKNKKKFDSTNKELTHS